MSPTSSRWTEPNYHQAVAWCKTRQKQHIKCTIAFLGGIPEDDAQAQLAYDTNMNTIRLIGEQELNTYLTVKPSVLGALLDRVRCSQRTLSIARLAADRNLALEIATEGIDLVSYAFETAVACANENKNMILDLQAYLNRTSEDQKAAAKSGVKVRLVKGAYVGDAKKHEEIQSRFRILVEAAAENSQEVLLGTHDPELIDWVKAKFRGNKQAVEFGFLKGLSDKTKVELANQGWRVLEYVPFGEKTEAYENRRLKSLQDLEVIGRAPAS
jgi:proline dehydrogenase